MLVFVPFMLWGFPESCRFMVSKNPQDPRIGRVLQRIDRSLSLPPGTTFTTTEVASTGIPLAGLFRDGRAPMTILLWVAMGAAICVTATLTAWLPVYLHVLGGLEVSTATHMSAVSAFGAISGPILLTLLMKRVGMPASLMTMLFLAFAAMCMLAMVREAPTLGWGLSFCFGLLVIGSQAGLNALVASSYPTSMRSTGIGWAGGIGRLTSIVGPGLGGAMLAAHWGPWQIYPVIAAPLLVAAVAMMIFHIIKAGDATAMNRDKAPSVAAH
jgi:AAHS family 4-hydroxybenzoate transporter-like MFS transporter